MDAFTPVRLGLRATTGAIRLATWPARAAVGELRDRLSGPDAPVAYRPPAEQAAPPRAARPRTAPPPPTRAPDAQTTAPPPRPVRPVPAPAPEPARTAGEALEAAVEELTDIKTIDDTPELVETEGGGGAHAEIRVDEPWPGYGRMRAPDIVDRLAVADAAEKAVVRLYEQQHRRRKSILAATG